MNIEKFSFGELTSNMNGKTSAASTGGIYLVLLGGITFVYGCFIHNSEIMSNSTLIIGFGSSLILGKKIMDGHQKLADTADDTTSSDDTTSTDASN